MDDRQNEILRWLRESKIETDDLEVALAEVRSRRDELLAHGHKAGLSVAEMARAMAAVAVPRAAARSAVAPLAAVAAPSAASARLISRKSCAAVRTV